MMTLDIYLKQIDATPLLTAEEEKALARRVQDGDPEARDHMIRANLRLVVAVARCYKSRQDVPLDERIAEGNLGLIRAVEMFDPDVGVKFSTYAAYWIKQSINRLLHRSRTIPVPLCLINLISKYERLSRRLLYSLGREPSFDEVIRHLGELCPKRQLRLKEAMKVVRAEREDEYLDILPWEDKPSQEEEITRVLKHVRSLDERVRLVLGKRFGLDGEEAETLQQVGDRLGLTRERVRQIEFHSLEELRTYFKEAVRGTRSSPASRKHLRPGAGTIG